MRRFKKKILGWITPTTTEKMFVQRRDAQRIISTITDEIIDVRDLSLNVTIIVIKKKV
tara:strand:+ start:571 stop:744 length:174 start_codon:yes stop_codon:yes gene_type:complete